MKTIRDDRFPERDGWIHVPDDVKAVLDLVGYKVELLARLPTEVKTYRGTHYADVYLPDRRERVLNMSQQRTRGKVMCILAQWVREGCPESEELYR